MYAFESHREVSIKLDLTVPMTRDTWLGLFYPTISPPMTVDIINIIFLEKHCIE